MKKFVKINLLLVIVSLLILPFALSTPTTVQAESEFEFEDENFGYRDEGENSVLDRMRIVAGEGKYVTDGDQASVPRIVGLFINALLSVTGLIFIILTVYAGINWMTSQGNEEKIKKSKDTLTASIIGLIVTLSAWTIWNFIFVNLIL